MRKENYAMFEYSKKLIKSEKYQEAIVLLKKLLKFDPYNANKIKFELARCLSRFRNTRMEAKRYFEELLETSNVLYATLELGKLEAEMGNIDAARYYFEYLLKYSHADRNMAMLELGKLEVSAGNIELARKYFYNLIQLGHRTHANMELGKLEKLVGNDELAKIHFDDLLNAPNSNYALRELFYIELKAENYMLACKYLELLLEKERIVPVEYQQISFYLMYKLGHYEESQDKLKSFFERQLVNYNEQETLNHINLHLKEDVDEALFSSNINTIELFQFAKKEINKLIPRNSTVVEKYIIDCGKEVGTSYGIPTTKIEVVTLLNTTNILTMYPVVSSFDSKKIMEYKLSLEKK